MIFRHDWGKVDRRWHYSNGGHQHKDNKNNRYFLSWEDILGRKHLAVYFYHHGPYREIVSRFPDLKTFKKFKCGARELNPRCRYQHGVGLTTSMSVRRREGGDQTLHPEPIAASIDYVSVHNIHCHHQNELDDRHCYYWQWDSASALHTCEERFHPLH